MRAYSIDRRTLALRGGSRSRLAAATLAQLKMGSSIDRTTSSRPRWRRQQQQRDQIRRQREAPQSMTYRMIKTLRAAQPLYVQAIQPRSLPTGAASTAAGGTHGIAPCQCSGCPLHIALHILYDIFSLRNCVGQVDHIEIDHSLLGCNLMGRL
jgi:hypothetical protein